MDVVGIMGDMLFTHEIRRLKKMNDLLPCGEERDYEKSKLVGKSISTVMAYVSLMLDGVRRLPELELCEGYRVVRSITVAGMNFQRIPELQNDDYKKKLREEEEKFDVAAAVLAEKLEKYMRLRKLAGIG